MGAPFKIKGVPARNANNFPEKQIAKIGPERPEEKFAVNEPQLDVVPGHNPAIPWPPAEKGSKPFKGG